MSSAQSELSLCKYVCALRMTPTHRKAVFGQRVFRLPLNSFSRTCFQAKTTSHYICMLFYIFSSSSLANGNSYHIYLQTCTHMILYQSRQNAMPLERWNCRRFSLEIYFLGLSTNIGGKLEVPCCVAAYSDDDPFINFPFAARNDVHWVQAYITSVYYSYVFIYCVCAADKYGNLMRVRRRAKRNIVQSLQPQPHKPVVSRATRCLILFGLTHLEFSFCAHPETTLGTCVWNIYTRNTIRAALL